MTVYRLVVEYDDTQYWRQVKSYENHIQVSVTFSQRLTQLDWKWIIGLTLTAVLLPAMWRWIDIRRKRKAKAA